MPGSIVSTGGRVVEWNGGTGTVTKNVWHLSRIRWVSSGAGQGDTCVVKDAAGNVIFESEATGADWSDEVELAKVEGFLGVQVTTLTSGTVYFYLK